jgi:hypothetical protein
MLGKTLAPLDALQRPPPADLSEKGLNDQGEVRPGKDDEEADGAGGGNFPKVRIGILERGELGEVLLSVSTGAKSYRLARKEHEIIWIWRLTMPKYDEMKVSAARQ